MKFYKVYGFNKKTGEELQHFLAADNVDSALYDACVSEESDGWLWRVEQEYTDAPTHEALVVEYYQYLTTAEPHSGLWRGFDCVWRWLAIARVPKHLGYLATKKYEQLLKLLQEQEVQADPYLKAYVSKQIIVVAYFAEQTDHIVAG